MERLSIYIKLYLFCVIGVIAIVGAIIAEFSSDIFSDNVSKETRTVFGLILLCFIIFHVFLIWLFAKVWGELSNKSNELITSKQHAQEVLRKLEHSYRETVTAASAAIDARDSYTAGHSKRVAGISCEIGRELELQQSQLECLELAALFHDIGKIGIPDNILNKPGRFTEEEYKIIKQHPEFGYAILKNIEFLQPMLPAILYHHERPDGKGYPKGLKAEEIPIGASIIALADTYDAMTSNRPYRNAIPHEAAIDELKKYSGYQFKKEVVDAFLRIEKVK